MLVQKKMRENNCDSKPKNGCDINVCEFRFLNQKIYDIRDVT